MVTLKSLAVAAAALVSGALAAPAPSTRAIEGSYIVKLKKDVVSTKAHLNWVNDIHARSLNKRDFAGVEQEINFKDFHAYTGQFDEDTIAEIKANKHVAYVEKDQIYQLFDVREKRELTTQEDAPYGLADISHRESGNTEYIYDSNAGEGTWAYVIDSGVSISHDDFEGRAEFGWTGYPGQEGDTDGHGTHVAGTIAGKTYGVAKKANIVAVKVFEGNQGSSAIVMKGFEFAVNDIKDKGRESSAVINMSLGGGRSQAFNDLVDEASADGVVSVSAAGNFNENADNYSPASASTSITVGATKANWAIADDWPNGYGSNWGKSLTLFAPGDEIESADAEDDSGSFKESGTSMASPHVAGLVLYAMSVDDVSGVDGITKHLVDNASADAVTGNLRGSPNLLANNGNSQQ